MSAAWDASFAMVTAALEGDGDLLRKLARDLDDHTAKAALPVLASMVAMMVEPLAKWRDEPPEELWRRFATGFAQAIESGVLRTEEDEDR